MRSPTRRTLVAEALPRPFGPYVLLSRLSNGAMAELFLAASRSPLGLDRLVVVKRVHASRGSDPSFVSGFVHEARLAASLAHPNIVQTLDAGTIDGRCFLATEHVHGENAHDALLAAKEHGESGLPVEHAVTLGMAVCAGLAYVHEKCGADGIPLGILHREICARNIVLGYTGDVKLVDFGIARGGIDHGDETPLATLKGKVGYLSPEQVMGATLDVRTDVFSLGVVLYELTTGSLPFRGRSDVETLTMVRDAPCPPPSALIEEYPPGLERIVLRALQKSPSERQASARQLQTELEQFAREAGLGGSHARLGAWMRAHFPERIEEHATLLRGLTAIVDALRPAPGGEGIPHESESDEAVTQMFRAPSMPPPTSTTIPPAPPWRVGATALLGTGALCAVGAIVYVARGIEREMAVRTDLLRAYHEEQIVRPAASFAALPPEPTGAVELTTNPPGSAIWVNGALRTETTPVTLDKMALDREIHIKLMKDGYEPFRTTLHLTDESPFKEVAADLKAIPATVVLHLEPAWGVNVWVDGKLWKGDRGAVDGLTPGVEHWFLLASPGYVARLASVTPGPGETTSLTVHLLKAGSK